MAILLSSLAAVLISQPMALPTPRPAVECSTHLTNASARHNCLEDLLREAERSLETSVDAARGEASDIEAETGSLFNLTESLETAQAAWMRYRDAECQRRASLMFVNADSQRDIELDCLVSLTRDRARELAET